MTEQTAHPFSDEQLLAFLHGAADAGLQKRIEQALEDDETLQARLAGLDPYAAMVAESANTLLSAAPRDRLKQLGAAAASGRPPTTPASNAAQASTRWWWPLSPTALAALVLIVFVAGLIAGQGLPGRDTPAEREEAQRSGPSAWIVAAVNYMKLNTLETFADERRDQAAVAANLESASGYLALDLSAVTQDTTPLYFQRSEILSAEGRPLVQLAYLHDSGTPVALYAHLPTAEAATEVAHIDGVIGGDIDGLNLTYWQDSTYEYVLIGDLPMEELSALAEEFSDRMERSP